MFDKTVFEILKKNIRSKTPIVLIEEMIINNISLSNYLYLKDHDILDYFNIEVKKINSYNLDEDRIEYVTNVMLTKPSKIQPRDLKNLEYILMTLNKDITFDSLIPSDNKDNYVLKTIITDNVIPFSKLKHFKALEDLKMYSRA